MIIYKSEEEIDLIKKSSQLAASTLNMIEDFVKPGVSTLELNEICHNYIIKNKAIPAPLNYRGFPKSICTSINDVVCHGIPSKKEKLKEGDIINIDVTTILNGYHGDTSRTYLVGNVSQRAYKLVKTTKECLDLGIMAVKPGGHIGDIGEAIQTHAEKNGYSVVREFIGHGLGKNFHEEPQVLHYGVKGQGIELKPGMVFTIEPMINEGAWQTKTRKDGWRAVTIDGKLSAQFEHTIAIRANGAVEILTISDTTI